MPNRRRVASLVAVALLASCQATPSSSPTRPAPSPTAAASATATPSPSATAIPITGRIAFVHNSVGSDAVPATDIWLVDAAGGRPTALTADPENEFTPFWLLDGSRLVFAVFDFRTQAGPYHGRLVSALPDGSGRGDLGPVGAFDQTVLSPDGRYVAWGGGGNEGIMLLDRSTGVAKVLTKAAATDPIWSPDGKALLVGEPYANAVAVVSVPSGHEIRFIKANSTTVGWTGDGQDVVFQTSAGIWLAPASGGPIARFPPNLQMAWPTWSSPDGRLTLAAGDGGAAFAVSTSDVNVKPTEVAPGLTMLTGYPSWAADDSAFAFAGSTSDQVGDRKSEIYVVGLDRVAPIGITAGPYDTSPAWEPGS